MKLGPLGRNILVGIPSRDGRGDYVTMGFMFQEIARRGDTWWIPKQDTILTSGHNLLWATALEWRVKYGLKYYLNLHDDVRPSPDFITAMLEIMERSEADVVGCSIAIKDDRGLTSTCVTFVDGHEIWRRRITLREMNQLPLFFDVSDVCKLFGYDASKCYLGVNTGLMMVRMAPAWVEKLLFHTGDQILKLPDGSFRYQVESEDWFFSRRVHEEGGRIVCTRAFEIQHLGVRKFSNFEMSGYDHDCDCGIPELAKLRDGVAVCAEGSGLVHGTGGASSVRDGVAGTGAHR